MTAAFRIAIPARYASTRFPGKPLAALRGRPMLEHVWRRAAEAGAGEVVIATDDERVAEAAAGFGAQACLTRADHASGTDRIAEVAERLGWAAEDIVVNLQGDEPAMPPALLAQVANDLAACPDAPVATLAVADEPAAAADPNIVKVVTDRHGYALYFSRAPIPFWRDGMPGRPEPAPMRHLGIYAYRAGFLAEYGALEPAPAERAEQLEQLRVLWHGYRIHVAEAATLPGPGLDAPGDVERVEAALARLEHGEASQGR